MARAKRNILPGYPYHVTRRGHYGQMVFHNDGDRLAWLEWLGAALEQHDVQLHAYVLMGNHVHLLATPGNEDGLSELMKTVCQRLSWRVNQQQGRTGALWEGRFHAGLVADDPHFMACMRYIELNPVRAGLAATPHQWRWSSHGANAQGRADPLVRAHAVYESLGPDRTTRQLAYRRLLDEPIPDAMIDALRQAALRGFAAGDPATIHRLERNHGVRLGPRPRGPRRRAEPDKSAMADLFE